MSTMNLFYILIYAENFMCIYRNFFSLTKNQKIIAITRIIVELSLSIAITVNNVILSDFVDFDYSDKDKLMTDILQFLTLFKSLVIVIGGVVTAEAFSRFTDNLRKLHNCFKDNEYYENAAKNLRVKCLVGFVVFTVMGVILLLVRLIDWYSLETYLLREIIILVVHELWVDIRYTLEHLVVYCAITTTYNYLKCLSIAVNDVLKRYNEQDNTESSSDGNEDIVDLPKKVNYWTEKYQNIMACCKNISLCYQELLLFSVAVAMVQCIYSMYGIFNAIIKKDVQRRLGTSNIVYSLIYHMSATITLLFAGQKLQNEFNSFNKALALLACEVSSHHAKSETRQLKDLNRLVTTNPIVIKFSTFSLGMYLFPMMLSLSATYIVVMLQFNHVI
ncbi:hypothetical protein HF086_017927 [Spodoptera exigua]|uniref:Gustatory receptor n=1 Tax=Spodoptera exigua TaxID=7107 RepID=A0A922MF26_SPOEX|nr:hypothetical protein HF086_017927 [Spodoptera exigua]